MLRVRMLVLGLGILWMTAACSFQTKIPIFDVDGQDQSTQDASGDVHTEDSVADSVADSTQPDSTLPDSVEPDSVEPDIVENSCVEGGGVCMDECTGDFVAVYTAGCGNQMCCMKEEPQCAGLGETVPVVPDAPKCCNGLVPIGQADFYPDTGECMLFEGAMVCTNCGNGTCEYAWETPCSCPEDCNEPYNYCVADGGTCLDGGCPSGFAEVDLGGCGVGQACCFATPDNCLKAGEFGGGMPNQCCAGLDQTGVFDIDPETGECQPLLGGYLCTDCGNGVCETWEDHCSCKEDCEPPVFDCYGPLEPCPAGQYCRIPDGTCDIMGQWGTCKTVPDGCPEYWDPVCGCDQKTYGNECELEASSMGLDYPGECEGPMGCVEEGGKFEGFDGTVECCNGLEAVNDCILDADGSCACPNCPCFVCTKCGDGTCGIGENQCNCPTDCQ